MIYIVGTGPMAIEYAKILIELNQPFQVIGRGEESAQKFESVIGQKPFVGGLSLYLNNHQITADDSVIIATGTEVLLVNLKLVLEAGVGKVLIEKPGGISIEELKHAASYLDAFSEKVFVAYNRRFFSSVIEAQKLIAEDGGLESMHFEFTEWAHVIEPIKKAEGVKENWFFANSTHVVDLAFYLAGLPKEWQAYSQKGELNWHPKTKFVGAGITEKNVLFSYISNWESAGRWAIELMTKNRRIYLKPMEDVGIQKKGTIAIEKHEFIKNHEDKFKPGFYLQIYYFLNDTTQLKTLKNQIADLEIYSKILGS